LFGGPTNHDKSGEYEPKNIILSKSGREDDLNSRRPNQRSKCTDATHGGRKREIGNKTAEEKKTAFK